MLRSLSRTRKIGAAVLALASAAFAQTPCFDSAIGTDQNMADDQMIQGLSLGFTFTYNGVGYTSACLDSNGSIYLGATTTALADFSPTELELLNSPQPRICGLWTDFQANAAGSGHIYFNAVPASGGNPAYALFTWNGVYEYSRTTPITVQVRLDANNLVRVFYGATGAIGGTLNTTVIIGASPGLGAASNPVSFATRPVSIGQANFADVRAVPNTPAGFTMDLIPTPPGYLAIDTSCAGPASVVPFGTGCPQVAGLNAGDDTTHPLTLPFSFPHSAGATSNIIVSSNGFLTLGTSTAAGSGCCSGTPATLLSGPPRVAGYWTDLDASSTGSGGNGEVYAGLNAATGDYVVTWFHIGEFSNTPVHSLDFQIALSPTGTIAIRYGAVAFGTHQALAGYSDGNGAADPGATDLSAIVGAPSANTIYEVFTASTDLSGLNFLLLPNAPSGYLVIPGAAGPFVPPLQPLALSSTPPQLNSTVTFTASNISAPPAGNACLLIISFIEQNPPFDLGQIGATGCNAYVVLDPSHMEFLNFPLGGVPTTTFTANVPNNPGIIGLTAIAQAASDDPIANSFGFKFSNALRLTVGL